MEKILTLGKIESRKKSGEQKKRWFNSITDSVNMSLCKLGDSEGQGSPSCCNPWHSKESDKTEQENSNNKRLQINIQKLLYFYILKINKK